VYAVTPIEVTVSDNDSDAYEQLLSQLITTVYVPQFVSECAARGLVLQTDGEVKAALALGAKLRLLATNAPEQGPAQR
jgi:hypothetical protein